MLRGHHGVMTRTIELPLPEELLLLVDERAENAGLAREAYIYTVLLRVVSAKPTVSEIVAPFRSQVADSSITDEDLDRLFSQARDESHRERSTRRIDER